MKINYNLSFKDLKWKNLKVGSVVRLIEHNEWTKEDNLQLKHLYTVSEVRPVEYEDNKAYYIFRVSIPLGKTQRLESSLCCNEQFKLIKI